MTNCGRRWRIAVAVAGVVLGGIPWMHSPGWGQDASPVREEQPTPANEGSDENAPAPSQSQASSEKEILPAPETEAPRDPESEVGPREYTVQKGDTLWSISHTYLNNSFLWPKVWKNNEYIINPDLIYPGNVIMFPQREASPQPPPSPALPQPLPTELPQPVIAPPPPPEVEPPAPMEVAKEIQVEVPEETALVVKPSDPSLLAASGYILTGQKAVGVVVGARDNRELIGQGETAYLLPQRGLKAHAGERYTLYRVVRKVYHPKTGKYLGDLVRILGVAEIREADTREKTVSAHLLISYDYAQSGDLMMPVQSPQESLDETAASPSRELKGYIVEVKEDRLSQAQSDVVYLDRGRRDGIRAGNRFAVVREGEKTSFFSPGKGAQLPQRVIGELEVIAVQDITATAKVIKGTEVIFKGDRFETPAPP